MPSFIKIATRKAIAYHQAAKLCNVTTRTIYRWEHEGWPKLAERMVLLFDQGRIMPTKWTHAQFNARGNLELHNGEVSEVDILNQPYTRLLNEKLRREYAAMISQNKQLRKEINALEKASQGGAANDAFWP